MPFYEFESPNATTTEKFVKMGAKKGIDRQKIPQLLEKLKNRKRVFIQVDLQTGKGDMLRIYRLPTTNIKLNQQQQHV